MPRIYPRFAQDISKKFPRNVQDMPRYSNDMSKIGSKYAPADVEFDTNLTQ